MPLIALCYGRSGDKGDSSNIALIAREPRFFPLLKAAVTAEVQCGLGPWWHVRATQA